jgi:hypothetical protein
MAQPRVPGFSTRRNSVPKSVPIRYAPNVTFRLSLALVLVLVSSACRQDGGPSSQVSSEWMTFHGIQFRVPVGTRAETTDGVLPGPEGMGGIPTGDRPSTVLILPGPHGFYVEIIKTNAPVSMEAMKHVLVGSQVGQNHDGEATSTGWEMTYETRGVPDASTKKTHIQYFEVAGGYYQCIYGEANCGDPAAAEAICRSIRPKPVK